MRDLDGVVYGVVVPKLQRRVEFDLLQEQDTTMPLDPERSYFNVYTGEVEVTEQLARRPSFGSGDE